MFSIVAFPATKECEAVPSGWLEEDGSCWWPPYKSLKHVEEVIKQNEVPDTRTWTMSKGRVLGTAGTKFVH